MNQSNERSSELRAQRLLVALQEARDSLLDPVWPYGRNPDAADGHHYVARGFQRPVSVSRVEAFVLANLVLVGDVDWVIEIGTGFGYSTLWMAIALELKGSQGRVISVDDRSEGGLGHEGVRIARQLARAVGVADRIEFQGGHSPGHLASITQDTFDMAFIDGDHHGDQPLMDFQAVDRHLRQSGLVVFHDDDERYEVSRAIESAATHGYLIDRLITSCRMTTAYRDPEWKPAVERAMAASIDQLLLVSRFRDS